MNDKWYCFNYIVSKRLSDSYELIVFCDYNIFSHENTKVPKALTGFKGMRNIKKWSLWWKWGDALQMKGLTTFRPI